MASRIAFTAQDDENIVQFLARRNPEQKGRSGNVIWKELAESKNPEYAWAKHHSWHSWRDRYQKSKARFDVRIDLAVKKLRKGKRKVEATSSSNAKDELPSAGQTKVQPTTSDAPQTSSKDPATNSKPTSGAKPSNPSIPRSGRRGGNGDDSSKLTDRVDSATPQKRVRPPTSRRPATVTKVLRPKSSSQSSGPHFVPKPKPTPKPVKVVDARPPQPSEVGPPIARISEWAAEVAQETARNTPEVKEEEADQENQEEPEEDTSIVPDSQWDEVFWKDDGSSDDEGELGEGESERDGEDEMKSEDNKAMKTENDDLGPPPSSHSRHEDSSSLSSRHSQRPQPSRPNGRSVLLGQRRRAPSDSSRYHSSSDSGSPVPSPPRRSRPPPQKFEEEETQSKLLHLSSPPKPLSSPLKSNSSPAGPPSSPPKPPPKLKRKRRQPSEDMFLPSSEEDGRSLPPIVSPKPTQKRRKVGDGLIDGGWVPFRKATKAKTSTQSRIPSSASQAPSIHLSGAHASRASDAQPVRKTQVSMDKANARSYVNAIATSSKVTLEQVPPPPPSSSLYSERRGPRENSKAGHTVVTDDDGEEDERGTTSWKPHVDDSRQSLSNGMIQPDRIHSHSRPSSSARSPMPTWPRRPRAPSPTLALPPPFTPTERMLISKGLGYHLRDLATRYQLPKDVVNEVWDEVVNGTGVMDHLKVEKILDEMTATVGGGSSSSPMAEEKVDENGFRYTPSTGGGGSGSAGRGTPKSWRSGSNSHPASASSAFLQALGNNGRLISPSQSASGASYYGASAVPPSRTTGSSRARTPSSTPSIPGSTHKIPLPPPPSALRRPRPETESDELNTTKPTPKRARISTPPPPSSSSSPGSSRATTPIIDQVPERTPRNGVGAGTPRRRSSTHTPSLQELSRFTGDSPKLSPVFDLRRMRMNSLTSAGSGTGGSGGGSARRARVVGDVKEEEDGDVFGPIVSVNTKSKGKERERPTWNALDHNRHDPSHEEHDGDEMDVDEEEDEEVDELEEEHDGGVEEASEDEDEGGEEETTRDDGGGRLWNFQWTPAAIDLTKLRSVFSTSGLD